MSDMQNFIDVPRGAQDFMPRVRQSLQTGLAFLVDQRWATLLFLLVYSGLMIWEYRSVRLLPTPPPPDWIASWPDFLKPLKTQMARGQLATWRSHLAGLVTLLFWGNGLLYIADRSRAFQDETVVGLGRALLRGFGITLLLSVPLALGMLLLVIPGLLVLAILMAAAAIAIFLEMTVFQSIGEGYRLVTRGLPGQTRVLGFSRSFVHIIGAYALAFCATWLFHIITIFMASGIAPFSPHRALPLSYAQDAVAELVGSFLNLSFSIFLLRLYSEYRTLVRR